MNAQGAFNTPVDVTAFYFGGSRKIKLYPKRIELNGTVYNLLEDGLRLLVKKGHTAVSFFSMTDGNKRFRIKYDPASSTWTLLSIKNE